MLSALIIVFREVLEAALVIGIVCAATRGVSGRGRAVVGGVGLGLAGAALVAVFTDVIGGMAEGMGQELFNALILLTVAVMLAWHNIWMSVQGAELAANARQTGAAVRDGGKPLTVLVVLVGLAVLREGAEVVLFIYGVAANGTEAGALALGSGLGLGVGALVGLALYVGLIRVPMRYFFSFTAAMLMLLAAGMAAQAAKFLVQGDFLPALKYDLWDTSGFIDNGSLAGSLLHTLVGYDAQPTGMQLLFYVLTLGLIALGTQLVNSQKERKACRADVIQPGH